MQCNPEDLEECNKPECDKPAPLQDQQPPVDLSDLDDDTGGILKFSAHPRKFLTDLFKFKFTFKSRNHGMCQTR